MKYTFILLALITAPAFAGSASEECIKEKTRDFKKELVEGSYYNNQFNYDYRCQLREATGEFSQQEVKECIKRLNADAEAMAEKECKDR